MECPTVARAAEARLPGVVLEREALPDLLGEGILRGDGAALVSAAHRRASLRRVGGGARLLPQAARRRDVAAQRALRRAGLLSRPSPQARRRQLRARPDRGRAGL